MLSSVDREGYTVYFERDPTDPGDRMMIWAVSQSGTDLRLERTEPSLNVPYYGSCHHYASPTPTTIQFFDQCPESIERRFVIAFNVSFDSGSVDRFETKYMIKKAGYWWEPDGP